MPQMELIDPCAFPGWNELLLTADRPSFFHSSCWAAVLAESYGYRPLYLAGIENGRLKMLLPVMEVKSFLTGRRGVSLPFTDRCPLIGSQHRGFDDLLARMLAWGGQAKWRYLELRSGAPVEPAAPASKSYYGHVLKLCPDTAQLWAGLRGSTRRNIRRAEREGVRIQMQTDLPAVAAFYRLNCLTRREHGLPPQPFNFFRAVFRHVLSCGQGIVALARAGERVVAGAVFFHFGQNAVFKFGASDLRFQHLRPNNLLLWQAIEAYARRGCRSLSLGRSDLEHEGLVRFKDGWGAEKSVINYYQYDFARKSFAAGRAGLKPCYAVFRKTPLPVLRMAGRLLYRHAE